MVVIVPMVISSSTNRAPHIYEPEAYVEVAAVMMKLWQAQANVPEAANVQLWQVQANVPETANMQLWQVQSFDQTRTRKFVITNLRSNEEARCCNFQRNVQKI